MSGWLADALDAPFVGLCFGETRSADERMSRDRPAPVDPEPGLSLSDLVGGRPEWMDRGACSDPGIPMEWFFPESRRTAVEAKRVCAGCAVRVECAEYAIPQAGLMGVWGGLSVKERRRIRADREITTDPNAGSVDRRRRAREMAAAGVAAPEIARELSVSRRTVGRYLERDAA